MTPLDDRMSSAIRDLNTHVDQIDVPAFEPKRSKAPAALMAVVLLALGLASIFANPFTDDRSEISVATQTTPPAAADTPPTPAEPLIGRLTSAEPGDFYVPLPAATAWNNDETLLLLYRTGERGGAHVVLDATSGDIVATLPFEPPDIEQIYWHPTESTQLLYAQSASLLSYDLSTMQSTPLATFESCDRVDSGRLPAAPSSDGTLGLLCHQGARATLLAYNVLSGTERRSDAQSDTAPLPSPSGENLVVWNDDGSASVFDPMLADTGVRLDLDGNQFTFVTTPDDNEWVAAALYDGPVVGSVVLLPLDGSQAPVVVIGPDRGDVYPPSGTRLSSTGAVIAMTVDGPDDGELAGRVHRIDLEQSITEPSRTSVPHGSVGAHGYWSNPFVSLSPSGRLVVYSTDLGGPQVDAFVTDLGDTTG